MNGTEIELSQMDSSVEYAGNRSGAFPHCYGYSYIQLNQDSWDAD